MGADSFPTLPTGPLLSDESATLLQELGDYFTRTAQMWSTMTENLLQGPHIDQIAIDVNNRSHRNTGLTDLTTSAAVHVEISRLWKVRTLTAKFSQDVQAVWHPGDGISDSSSSSQVARGGQLPFAHILSHTLGQDTHFVGHGHPTDDNLTMLASGSAEQTDPGKKDDSNSDSGDEELFPNSDMAALKQRGKGMYTCPNGPKCDKGGVDKDGNVIVFDRNSSFAQHCNKHRKPWVCDLPNCPNRPKKHRFARRDGLERHKHKVKHEPRNPDPQNGAS